MLLILKKSLKRFYCINALNIRQLRSVYIAVDFDANRVIFVKFLQCICTTQRCETCIKIHIQVLIIFAKVRIHRIIASANSNTLLTIYLSLNKCRNIKSSAYIKMV